MSEPKFNIGDKVIQIAESPRYFSETSGYKPGITIVTVSAIRRSGNRDSVYGFEECGCSDCKGKEPNAHWNMVEKNFKLADIKPKEKPKPKTPIKKMTQKDFTSALKDIA